MTPRKRQMYTDYNPVRRESYSLLITLSILGIFLFAVAFGFGMR